MWKLLIGALGGFVLSFFTMLIIESNYFAAPVTISGETLIDTMKCTIRDGSFADWWLKEKDDKYYLVELKYPTHRQLFSIPLNDIEIKNYKSIPTRIKREDIIMVSK